MTETFALTVSQNNDPLINADLFIGNIKRIANEVCKLDVNSRIVSTKYLQLCLKETNSVLLEQ